MWKATCTKFGYLIPLYKKVMAQNPKFTLFSWSTIPLNFTLKYRTYFCRSMKERKLKLVSASCSHNFCTVSSADDGINPTTITVQSSSWTSIPDHLIISATNIKLADSIGQGRVYNIIMQLINLINHPDKTYHSLAIEAPWTVHLTLQM